MKIVRVMMIVKPYFLPCFLSSYSLKLDWTLSPSTWNTVVPVFLSTELVQYIVMEKRESRRIFSCLFWPVEPISCRWIEDERMHVSSSPMTKCQINSPNVLPVRLNSLVFSSQSLFRPASNLVYQQNCCAIVIANRFVIFAWDFIAFGFNLSGLPGMIVWQRISEHCFRDRSRSPPKNEIDCFFGDISIFCTIILRQCVHNNILNVLGDLLWISCWFHHLTLLQVVLRNVLFERVVWDTNFTCKLCQATLFVVCDTFFFYVGNIQQVLINAPVGMIQLGLLCPNPYLFWCCWWYHIFFRHWISRSSCRYDNNLVTSKIYFLLWASPFTGSLKVLYLLISLHQRGLFYLRNLL